MLDSDDDEASDSRTPAKTETPVKAGELDPGRVELVLDVGVQVRVDLRDALGLIHVDVELIGHIEVVEAGLQHERLRLGFHALRGFAG